ncbi:MAG TPA: hypothetical protein VF683_06745 [Chthoniobacterales bacterium]
MHVTSRNGFYAGAAAAVALAVYLLWLWQPERQVRLHSEHLLAAVEEKDWADLAAFVDESYQDQWGNDRALLLTRLRQILSYAPGLKIHTVGSGVSRLGQDDADWNARVPIEAEENELTALMKTRVNALDTPFVFQWRHRSGKPWDWKLVRVSNDALELPDGGL